MVEEDALRDLPVTDNLFSVLDTMSAPVITDRFSSGGMSAAESSRAGAFMNSWTQTTFRLGDVDITSPDGGVPLLVPPLLFWQRVGVTAGGMPADASTPALLISLDPRRPSAQWTGTIDAFGLPPAFVAHPGGTAAPAIALPHASMHGGAVVSGPLVRDRLGVLVSAAWTRSSQFDRGNVAASAVPSEAGIASVFGHLLYTRDAQTEMRTVAWIQRAGYPSAGRVPYSPPGSSDHDAGAHVQSTWEHRASQYAGWRVFGGVTTHTRRAAAPSPGPATIERLNDGFIPTLIEAADGTRRRWTLGLRFKASPSALGRVNRVRHSVEAGLDTGRASARVTPAYPGSILELVDGIPARAWQYSPPREAHRSATTLDGFVTDRIDLSRRLTLDAVLRFDGVSGAARDAARGVAWRTWLPRAAMRWSIADFWRIALISGYERTADALPLGTLAYGDPASPVADVYRWRGGGNLGPLVARAGPGAGSDGLTTIDAHLARPTTGELDIGIEASPLPSMRLRFAHTLRREANALAVIDTGAPASSYAVSGIPDAGGNFQDPRDDQILPIFNRLPASFGADRYVLTNSPARRAMYRGMNLSVQASTSRLFLFAGGTTSFTRVEAGSRGFRVTENDPGILGERFTNPNASTHSRGNPFIDRQYNVKISGVYRFSRGVRLGVIARYQDGQAFSRMIVVPDLNQGAEAIHAIRNGQSRFTYTGTLDGRVQKEFVRGRQRVTLVMDVYNLPGMRKEVEEYVVTGPDFRDETAVQPPRTVLLGLRFSM